MTNLSSLSKALMALGAAALLIVLSGTAFVTQQVSTALALLSSGLFALALAFWMLARTRRAILDTQCVLAAVARGDFEARLTNVTEKGEIALLQHQANDLIDRLDAFVRESAAAMSAVRDHKYFRRILPGGLSGALLEGAGIMNDAMQAVDERICAVAEATNAFERAASSVVSSLSSSAQNMKEIATSVDASARVTSTQAVSVAAAAEEATTSVADVAASSERLSQSGRRICERMGRSAQVAREARENLGVMDSHVQALSEASDQIGKVVAMIQTIAQQTNLLALNATIEAARAGDAGKGFAVVAGEVKALAGQTAQATKEISCNITRVQQAANEAVVALNAIGAIVSEVDDMVGGIVSEAQSQSLDVDDIVRNIGQAAMGTQDVANNILGVSRASDSTLMVAAHSLEVSELLSTQSTLLEKEVTRFLTEIRADTHVANSTQPIECQLQ